MLAAALDLENEMTLLSANELTILDKASTLYPIYLIDQGGFRLRSRKLHKLHLSRLAF